MIIKWIEKNLIWISLLILSLPIGAYILNFRNLDLSNDPESWAQFGDYIGGTYSVLITILAIYIARNLSRKDASQERRQRVAEALMKQIAKIKKCTNQDQRVLTINKFMRLIDENQLVLSTALQTSMQELGDYFLGRINGDVENLAFEESKKEELIRLYNG